MVWNDAGMKTVLVKAIDSEGEDSGWVERWVDVQNLEPQIEELPEVMAVAEGRVSLCQESLGILHLTWIL